MAGVKMSERTMELRMPPTTAIASGFSIAEPVPMPNAKGSMPATVARAVMAMGRRRRRPAWIMASSAEKPRPRKRCSASRRRIPFFATMPMTMIMPMREATLNEVLVITSARNPPKLESNAEARIAAGAEKVRNSKSSTANRSSSAKNNTTNKSLDDFRSSAYRPPYSTRMDEGKCKLLTAFCTAAMPVPRSTFSNFAVTCIRRCKFSRRICVSPGSMLRVAKEPSVTHTVERRPVLFGKANTNGVRAVIQNDRGGSGLTFQNRGGVDCDFLESETCARGYQGIHLIRNRRAADGIFDSVQNFHDGVRVPSNLDFVDRFRDARSGFIQELAVLRIELDHDGLGRARQVADHVLKELKELNFGGGFGRFNLGSEIGDDIVDVALAIFLQPDGEISVVRFGDGCKPQLHAGAAGSVLNFGCGLQNFLNVQEDEVGFGERAARWSEVVQNESPFVHFGEELRAKKAVTQHRKSDDQDRARGQHPGPLQNGLHRPSIKLHDACKKAEMRFFHGEESSHVRTCRLGHSCGGFPPAYEVLAERGCPSQCQKERSKQRNGHGNGECAEESPGHSGDRNQGKKNDNRRNGRPNERNRQFPQGALNGLEPALPGITVQHNIFQDHDSVVDDQTDGGCEAAQSHQIETLIRQFQNDEGDEQSYRYDQSRHQ